MDLTKKRCVPCEKGTNPLNSEEEDELFPNLINWALIRNPNEPHKLHKTIVTESFIRGVQAINKIAEIAEQENHHPDIYLSYSKIVIELYTHKINGLSENDFILAAKIDKALGR